MTPTRLSPSADYLAILALTKQMHAETDAFTGIGCYKHRRELRTLVQQHQAKSLLDYGCGKGKQFTPGGAKTLLSKLKVYAESWQEALGVDLLHGYDPAVPSFAIRPSERFDGVYCCDVLEHIAEPDIPWVLDDIFSYAQTFVFLTVATLPAKKNLPDGRNAHVTIKDKAWWLEKVEHAAARHPNKTWWLWIEGEQEQGELWKRHSL